MTLELPKPYLLFLGDEREGAFAKTAFGLRDWASELCVGECALHPNTVTTGLPRITPAQGRSGGARSLLMGVAPRGGTLAPQWIPRL